MENHVRLGNIGGETSPCFMTPQRSVLKSLSMPSGLNRRMHIRLRVLREVARIARGLPEGPYKLVFRTGGDLEQLDEDLLGVHVKEGMVLYRAKTPESMALKRERRKRLRKIDEMDMCDVIIKRILNNLQGEKPEAKLLANLLKTKRGFSDHILESFGCDQNIEQLLTDIDQMFKEVAKASVNPEKESYGHIAHVQTEQNRFPINPEDIEAVVALYAHSNGKTREQMRSLVKSYSSIELNNLHIGILSKSIYDLFGELIVSLQTIESDPRYELKRDEIESGVITLQGKLASLEKNLHELSVSLATIDQKRPEKESIGRFETMISSLVRVAQIRSDILQLLRDIHEKIIETCGYNYVTEIIEDMITMLAGVNMEEETDFWRGFASLLEGEEFSELRRRIDNYSIHLVDVATKIVVKKRGLRKMKEDMSELERRLYETIKYLIKRNKIIGRAVLEIYLDAKKHSRWKKSSWVKDIRDSLSSESVLTAAKMLMREGEIQDPELESKVDEYYCRLSQMNSKIIDLLESIGIDLLGYASARAGYLEAWPIDIFPDVDLILGKNAQHKPLEIPYTVEESENGARIEFEFPIGTRKKKIVVEVKEDEIPEIDWQRLFNKGVEEVGIGDIYGFPEAATEFASVHDDPYSAVARTFYEGIPSYVSFDRKSIAPYSRKRVANGVFTSMGENPPDLLTPDNELRERLKTEGSYDGGMAEFETIRRQVAMQSLLFEVNSVIRSLERTI